MKEALQFARPRTQGVLTTIRKDGRPQVSNILYALNHENQAQISLTATRAKTRNLLNDPRCTLYVPGDSFWGYVVFDATATLSHVTHDPHDEVADQLVELYRAISGKEHPNWEEYRTAMAAEHRLIATLTLKSAVGMGI